MGVGEALDSQEYGISQIWRQSEEAGTQSKGPADAAARNRTGLLFLLLVISGHSGQAGRRGLR